MLLFGLNGSQKIICFHVTKWFSVARLTGNDIWQKSIIHLPETLMPNHQKRNEFHSPAAQKRTLETGINNNSYIHMTVLNWKPNMQYPTWFGDGGGCLSDPWFPGDCVPFSFFFFFMCSGEWDLTEWVYLQRTRRYYLVIKREHQEKCFAYVSIITKSICWRPSWIVDHLEVSTGECSNEDYLL